MSLTIYGIGASRASRPLWTALELGVPFQHVPTPYAGGATRTPEYLAINPNGHIPAVVDERPEGRVVVWESMACALYIARHHGQADGVSIAPATPFEDAQALRWSFWAASEAEADALTVLMHRMVMPAERRLAVPFRVIEAELTAAKARGHAFLAADRFTVADLLVATVLGWARMSGPLMQAHPVTAEWLGRCVARPAFAQARGMA
jgi:glutathione S-transferase